jgi:hypothetical protein
VSCGKFSCAVPVTKEVGNIAGGSVTKLKFYLADVEAFSAPMVVIPDIGGDPNAYFMSKITMLEKIRGVARNTRP